MIITISVWTKSAASGENFTIRQIADGVYLHPGITVGLTDPERDNIANIGFIVGDNCVAVIDTGGSVKIGTMLLDAIHQTTDKPVCFVINTHVHFDHVLGNLAFKQKNVQFWGHNNLPAAIDNSREFFLQNFRNDLGNNPGPDSIVGPDHTVSDHKILDLGNREIELTAWPAAHTHTDLTVLDKKSGVFWAGDLVFREHIPVIDGSLKGWLSVMPDLEKIKASKIIPGHGPVADNWKDALSAQYEYLNTLLTETRQAIADGKFMEEAIDTIGQGQKDKWKLFDQHHKSNVSKAFTELEWE